MIKKKSSFLTFIFSLLPGAGEMYMGFMKRGVSLMIAFFFSIFLSSWLSIGPIIFIIPVIWFYSFFDVHNLRSMPDDEFYAFDDDYIFWDNFIKDKSSLKNAKYRKYFAIILIFLGIIILWNNVFDMIEWLLPDYLYDMIYRFSHVLPQLVVSFIIIAIGIFMIRGKKAEINQIEDKGGSNNENA